MKPLLFFGLIMLPAICFSQALDTIAVTREVDSLIQVSRGLTGKGEFEKALEVNAAAEKLTLEKLGRETAAYGSACFNHGRILQFIRNYAESEKWYVKSKVIREKVLGKEHSDYGWSLYNLANLYREIGRYETAEIFYIEAQTIFVRAFGKENNDYATCIISLANLYSKMGRFSLTEPLYLEAKSIRERLLGKEHPDYASCIMNLANLYRNIGRYEEAEVHYLEAKAILEKIKGKENPEYASLILNLANLYSNMGRFESSEQNYVEAKEIQKKLTGVDHPNYAMILNNLGALYLAMGRYESAEPLYIDAKAIQKKSLGIEHPDYARSEHNLASLYHRMGRFKTAEPLYLEAIAIRGKVLGKEHPEYTSSIMNLANLYSDLGRYEAAELLFIEARTNIEKVFGEKHPDYARCLNGLANLYYYSGNYKAAETLYLETIAITESVSGKEHPDYARSLHNLGLLYSNMGRYELAEPLYQEALAISEKVFGKEHPDHANNLNSLALLYSNIGRNEIAESLYIETLAIREKVLGKEHPDYASSLNNLASFYAQLGRYDQAEPLFLEALAVREKILGKDHPFYADNITNLGFLYCQIERYDIADSLLLEGNTLNRALITKSSRFQSERELSSYLNLFVKNLDAYFSFAQSRNASNVKISTSIYDNALFHKGFLLTASQQLKHLAESDTSSTKKFEVLTSYHLRLAKEYTKPITERQNVAALEEKANTLEKQLARSVPGFEAALRQVSWQEVQGKLKAGEVAVEFIQYHYYNPKPTDSVLYSALVLRPGDKAPLFVPLFEERAILPLLEGAKGGNVRGINALYSTEEEKSLYNLIWKPLEGLLQGPSTLYCSPSGLLHRLNLGAIPTDKGQTFSELYKLVLLGSTRQLVVPNLTNAAGNSAYVAGGIRYDIIGANAADENAGLAARGMTTLNELPFYVDSTARGGSWKYLPNSATEALEISKILNGQKFAVQLDTGYLATEESFKRLGASQPSPRTILLATHGFFFPDPKPDASEKKMSGELAQPVFKTSNDPLIRSGLILAGGQQTWKTGKGKENREDGILTAYEISQMNLSGTELVVLSACETGLGDIVGNEGVYGLQRAFKIAGAKYLIMSLWSVNDISTREFMTEFYRQWLKKGLSIPEAFRTTQQKMKIKYKDPYHWAGFVLIE